MSFLDLATVTLHRQNELEGRIHAFDQKCDHAIEKIEQLKIRARDLLSQLNCDPAELRERFLNSMRQLDEYTYLITDFHLAAETLEELSTIANSSVQATKLKADRPAIEGYNIIDALSENTPSTSTACSNQCPVEKVKPKKVPKAEQTLIVFSSTSCSSESVSSKKAVDVKVEPVEVPAASPAPNCSPANAEAFDFPAQTVLEVDHTYPANVIHIDGGSLWIFTESIDDIFDLVASMNSFYKTNNCYVTASEAQALTSCACYDEGTDSYYRALVIRYITENSTWEMFFVDTGEVHIIVKLTFIRKLMPQFREKPPFARLCHLAGIELINFTDEARAKKQELAIKQAIGVPCTMTVDDNSSESLGVFLMLPTNVVLNTILVENELAVAIDKTEEPQTPAPVECKQGPPELLEENILAECPEYDDPVEAVTGYRNRDEIEICKHYKGGPEKTCFKGALCKKKHVLKHPDGWTLDKVEVLAKCPSLPLPAPGTDLKVHVTYVNHFNRMYVHLLGEKEKEKKVEPPASFGFVMAPKTLETLMRDMNCPAARAAYKNLKMIPAPGELVAALYIDDQWYRAKVLSYLPAEQSFELMYIDYGNVLWVKEDSVRELHPRFVSLPRQAVQCVLAGVTAKSSNSKQWALAKNKLTEMVQGRNLDAYVISRGYDEVTLELYDEAGYCIGEQLAALDLVAFSPCVVREDLQVTQQFVVP